MADNDVTQAAKDIAKGVLVAGAIATGVGGTSVVLTTAVANAAREGGAAIDQWQQGEAEMYQKVARNYGPAFLRFNQDVDLLPHDAELQLNATLQRNLGLTIHDYHEAVGSPGFGVPGAVQSPRFEQAVQFQLRNPHPAIQGLAPGIDPQADVLQEVAWDSIVRGATRVVLAAGATDVSTGLAQTPHLTGERYAEFEQGLYEINSGRAQVGLGPLSVNDAIRPGGLSAAAALEQQEQTPGYSFGGN